ncbi:VOC family protein [Enterococcus wangshanyuanii]|uniref:Glyoxalase/bleomycin resistance protein n=1 Tax=Enterococcus wangshanyuanii TaxID=2005703 RepID=A0ABQ1PUT9_9ENTE|nr:VOC family protein [Enterococcus wangshanyuanii]GGD04143.1 putative glyoxalase/bleomycin resistance protein [Enterococcus wangshanyuanii]
MTVIIKKASINLFVPNTEKAMNFYENLFDAKRIELTISEKDSSGRFNIGESMFALADEQPESEAKSPLTLKGTPFCIQLICDNVDELVEKSLNAGCTLEMPVMIIPDKFKVANVKDPFGFVWSISEVYGD